LQPETQSRTRPPTVRSCSSLLAVGQSGDCINGCRSDDARNRHQLPRQVITVARVKYSSCHPRSSPLAKRVAHDDERQKLSKRSGAEALGSHQRNEHVVGAYGKTTDNGEGPEHRGRVRPRGEEYLSSDQTIEKSHDAVFLEAIGQIANHNWAALT